MNGRTHHRDLNHRPSYGSVHGSGSTHSSTHSSNYGTNQRVNLGPNHGTLNNHYLHTRVRTPVTLPPTFPAHTPCIQPYATYDQPRIRINNRCKSFCTWKYACLTFFATTVFLTALLIYVFFLAFPNYCTEPTKQCIPLEASKAAAQDDHNTGQSLVISDNAGTEVAGNTSAVATDLHLSYNVSDQTKSRNGPEKFLENRKLVTHQGNMVLVIDELGKPFTADLQPFHFWNTRFFSSDESYIRLNITVSWICNIAVYGRRNNGVSITQYDFVEFIKDGRLNNKIKRPKRDTSRSRGDDRHASQNITAEETKTDIFPHYLYKPGFTETYVKNERNIRKRSSSTVPAMATVSILHLLEAGNWFFSVYNDDLATHEVTLTIEKINDISRYCPNECSGRGSCYLGRCDCIDGYTGADCSKSVCPILCSNHGTYGGGLCHCDEGWKGTNCDVPAYDCKLSDCSGHGKCNKGVCTCNSGWKGDNCDIEDCLDPTCSAHGKCVAGKCYCKAGWQGANCSVVNEQVFQCLPRCSDHGTYDLETGTCVCHDFWTGSDCSQALCHLNCGPHGSCDRGRCSCEAGWTGEKCDQLPCDPRCSQHGQCKNGTCICSTGWNGQHCTIAGCPHNCHGNGKCHIESGEYKCECELGWAGYDCSIQLETNCSDEIDNDHDGTVDCEDSECCKQAYCATSIYCMFSNDPVEVLLRKQPPSVTASFYQRVKFLVEENSVQSYPQVDEFSERRVAVIRGQCVSQQGLPIMGIRVSLYRDNKYGFTLTRHDGRFDYMVNGGETVTLQFQRTPFKLKIITVSVPWNQMIVISPVIMELKDENPFKIPVLSSPPEILKFPALEQGVELCVDHNESSLNPHVLSTWVPEKIGGPTTKRLIYLESQVLQDPIRIPGSNIYLLYRNSLSAGYLSYLLVQLTGSVVPPTLMRIYVHVEVEGCIFTKELEPDPNLTYTYTWDKRNIYKQKVYGITHAKVSIGYHYTNCHKIMWEIHAATMKGFEVDTSDIGGWSLDVHHHYNFHEGILQKGDGTSLYMKYEYPRTMRVTMGTGLQRPLVCKDCDGLANEARLLMPIALASGPDGSIYIGDFNLIRKLTPDGHIYTVLQLSATQVSYQYYLCLSPTDGNLYISDPERHQILRVLNLNTINDPTINSEVIAGSGERCVPGDTNNCGDDGPALEAKLSHPKGIAVGTDKTLYFADGTNIRCVDTNGLIRTLVGHHEHNTLWQPLPCTGAIPANQVQLQWPSGLAISPLDGSLHFIDDRTVLKLTADRKIQVVAGIPLHCRSSYKSDKTTGRSQKSKARQTPLGTVLSIAFSPFGELYIAESDAHKVSYIRAIDFDGFISDFAGSDNEQGAMTNNCDCAINNSSCQCVNTSREHLLSTTAKFSMISAIICTPDGVLHIADQGSLHVLSLQHYLPVHDLNGEYQIPFPGTNELYIFNRYGQHISTKDLQTGKLYYNFVYSKNTSFGKLASVSDDSGNKVFFIREYSNVVSSIENSQDYKADLTISGSGLLVKFSEKGKSDISLSYDSNTGLLTSHTGGDNVIKGGALFLFKYNELGRLSSAILPTGEVLDLSSTISVNNDHLELGITTPLHSRELDDKENSKPFSLDVRTSNNDYKKYTLTRGSSSNNIVSYSNGSFLFNSGWNENIRCLAEEKHPLLQLSLPTEAEMLPLLNHFTANRGSLTNVMSWDYELVGDAASNQPVLRKKLLVNNFTALIIDYDPKDKTEFIYGSRRTLMKIKYNHVALPTLLKVGTKHFINVSYDRYNRIDGWSWNDISEEYKYNRQGLVEEIKSRGSVTKYSYNEWNKITQIELPSGRKFKYVYDDYGGLHYAELPSGSRHTFSVLTSLGFIRYVYLAPGALKPYIQHYSYTGALLQEINPSDGTRILYRYRQTGQLSGVICGDGIIKIKYSSSTGLPLMIDLNDRDFEYRWELQYSNGLLLEERVDFSPKTGLSNAKFTFDYDSNFRLTSISGRIGGQSISDFKCDYSKETGKKNNFGQFKVSWAHENSTSYTDGTATFTIHYNNYFQLSTILLVIHSMEVFRMEFSYDLNSRIVSTQSFTQNVGVNSLTTSKNYTWDIDGQLLSVDAQESWQFKYDQDGNMLSLTYRGKEIKMVNSVLNRVEKFGEGVYKYNNRGFVVQNAREEKFQYNTRGSLVRAIKRGRFDVRYYYDHMGRMVTRKDNYGNVTQYFYTHPENPSLITHIYNPRDGRLMTLMYDDRSHLIFAQIFRHKYYIATDQCGTPMMIFNQYGEVVREIVRSPFGHIVYDSNPYLYLPIDFCGGLLDQVTSLIHMPNGKVYDPLVGQWMTPVWEGLLSRVYNPKQLHLYRFNGNDPVNVKEKDFYIKDENAWFSRLGYDLNSLAPQLNLPTSMSSSVMTENNNDLGITPLVLMSSYFNHFTEKLKTNHLTLLSSVKTVIEPKVNSFVTVPEPYDPIKSTLYGKLYLNRENKKEDIYPAANPEALFDYGIVLSKTTDNKVIVNSIQAASPIHRDVLVAVFNESFLLPFSLVVHGPHGPVQDMFYFVKKSMGRATEDQATLNRVAGELNVTVHEKEDDQGRKIFDLRIHRTDTVLNVRYGTTVEREKQRLLHHAKVNAMRRAWHYERELLKNGLPTTKDWTPQESEELQKLGYVSGYDGEYAIDVQQYPELSDDPSNIRFVKTVFSKH
ncbi:teneurin-a isoform X2 [Planococcus citri]|uniref:teneurin-a isoform X2 n=1 Tax=Planococcus citri TaxID=170843 RepID=UPI0031F98FB4